MRILPWLTGLAALAVAAGCQTGVERTTAETAAAPAALKPQWLTAAEFKAIDDDAAKAQEMDIFVGFAADAEDDAARSKKLAAAVLMTKYYLHQLFYPVNLETTEHPADDPDFYAALVSFERRAGLAVDGKFTVAEFSKLAHLATLEHETEIFTTFKIVSVSDPSASAEGTWTLQGDTIAYPVNRAQIRCWRSDRSCTVFTANITLPREDGAGSATLLTDVQYYDVTRWTATEVQAATQSICRQTVLTINGDTKQVYEVSTDLTKEGCPLLGPMDQPKVATLQDGFDLIRKVYEARKAPARAVSNGPMERLRELTEAETPTSP